MFIGTVIIQKLINFNIDRLLTERVLLASPAPMIAPTEAYEEDIGRPYPISRKGKVAKRYTTTALLRLAAKAVGTSSLVTLNAKVAITFLPIVRPPMIRPTAPRMESKIMAEYSEIFTASPAILKKTPVAWETSFAPKEYAAKQSETINRPFI